MINLDILRPTCAMVLGVFLSGLLLTTTLYAQEQGPSVSVRIILTGTVQGDAAVVPPQQKPDQQELTAAIVYPEKVRMNGIEGDVIVVVQVDKDGTLLQVAVRQSTYEVFEENAVEAAKAITSTPAVLHGKPIRMWLT